MRESNIIAKDWMLANGFDNIVTFGHNRYGMAHTWKEDGRVKTKNFQDLYGLFDRISINKDGFIFFVQIKTNAFPPSEPIQEFIKKTVYARGLAINVVKGKVRARLYNGEDVREITPNIKNFIKGKPSKYKKFVEKEQLVP